MGGGRDGWYSPDTHQKMAGNCTLSDISTATQIMLSSLLKQNRRLFPKPKSRNVSFQRRYLYLPAPSFSSSLLRLEAYRSLKKLHKNTFPDVSPSTKAPNVSSFDQNTTSGKFQVSLWTTNTWLTVCSNLPNQNSRPALLIYLNQWKGRNLTADKSDHPPDLVTGKTCFPLCFAQKNGYLATFLINCSLSLYKSLYSFTFKSSQVTTILLYLQYICCLDHLLGV